MDVIKVLSKDVSDLIAAGEVVERPSSVVKELVENSIDALSSQITIEIQNGGLNSIKISDNGIGMSPKDAELAFLKHATSKISSADDLAAIHTLGFRGEALCAISAVSIIDLYTNQDESHEGYYLHIEYGKITERKYVAFHKGTSIEIQKLFSNTPARLKFMKSDSAEVAAVSSLVQILAVSNPSVSFKYYVNSIEKLFTYGNGDLLDTIYTIEGKDFVNNLTKVSLSSSYGNSLKKISVSGYISKPHYNKASRNKEYFFINNRFIKSKLLQTALENGYKSYIMQGRFPVCILNITIPFDEVDINVHPGKLEAKFSDERAVFDIVMAAVNIGITKSSVSQPEFKISVSKNNIDYTESKKKPSPVNEQPIKNTDVLEDKGWHIVTPNENKAPVSLPNINKLNVDASSYEEKIINFETQTLNKIDSIIPKQSNEEVSFEEKKLDESINDYRFIGQCMNTYILLEDNDNLILIDKHALHERINFEKLKKANKINVQTLLSPLLISFDGITCDCLLSNKDTLLSLGFEIDSFGDNCIAVRTIPSMIQEDQVESLLNNFVGILSSNKEVIKSQMFDELLYDIACKASIQGGVESSDAELKYLAEQYLNNQKLFSYCPHGRPVMVTLSKTNIENNFKRKI